MNPWQLAQQIKHKLAAATWSGGSAEVVFGPHAVVVYAGAPPSPEALPAGFPCALVVIDNGPFDEDHPDLIDQDFVVVSIAESAGDPLGEFAVIGGPRPDLGKSAGAGVGEVAERVRATLQDLQGVDGATVRMVAANTGRPGTLGDGRHVAMDELTLTAKCTSQPYYAPPQEVQVDVDAWTWRGDQCESRFDFLQYVMGYVEGVTPAETPSELDAVIYTGADPDCVATPIEGNTYSVFAGYDPRGVGTVAHYSSGSRIGAYRTA